MLGSDISGDTRKIRAQNGGLSEKGSGYRLPHWEASKGRASPGYGPKSDLKINKN